MTVAMDGSCGSGGQQRRRSMAAVAVVFDGGSSVRRRLMASAMDYDERTRGRCKERMTRDNGATTSWLNKTMRGGMTRR